MSGFLFMCYGLILIGGSIALTILVAPAIVFTWFGVMAGWGIMREGFDDMVDR